MPDLSIPEELVGPLSAFLQAVTDTSSKARLKKAASDNFVQAQATLDTATTDLNMAMEGRNKAMKDLQDAEREFADRTGVELNLVGRLMESNQLFGANPSDPEMVGAIPWGTVITIVLAVLAEVQKHINK